MFKKNPHTSEHQINIILLNDFIGHFASDKDDR